MPASSLHLIDELTLAAAEPAVVRPVVVDRSTAIVAGFWSVVFHAILAFNAAVWTFHLPETIDARVTFARGEAAQAVEVQLTLMMASPAAQPTPVKPVEDEPMVEQVPPSPPVVERVEPQEPEPFEQTPPPVREPVDGAAPGRSPLANRVLEGDPADAAAPAPMEAVREIEREPPVATADALKPVEPPREKPVEPTPSLASANPAKTPVDTKTGPQAMPAPIAPSALEPTIDFTPPVITPPTPPQPAAPAARPPSEPASRAATAGVSSGVEAALVKPRYPALSIRAGEEGTIVLEIEVLPDGSVGFVRIIESPGHGRLEKAAIEAVRRSRFTPARHEGVAIRQVVRKSIRFRLEDA